MIKQKNSAYSPTERLINGVFKENPIFVLVLGICPTLATTTSAVNGLGMGLTTAVVLALSNVIISLLRNVIPDKVRIPAFIVIIASFVTMMELILQAYIPVLYNSLGIYIPLIVVNCIVLGRAETFASKENAILSFFDGLGMGIGFTIALTIIGAFREWLGAGKIFGFHAMPSNYVPVTIFVLAPGAFFVLAFLTAIQNKIKILGTRNGKDMSKIGSGCNDDCLNCPDKNGCDHSFYDTSVNEKSEIKEDTNHIKNSLPVIENNASDDVKIEDNINNAHQSKPERKDNTGKKDDSKKSAVKKDTTKKKVVKDNVVKEYVEGDIAKEEPAMEGLVEGDITKQDIAKDEISKKVNIKKEAEQKAGSGRKKITAKQQKEIKEDEKKAKEAEYRSELDAYSSTDEDSEESEGEK